MFGSENIKSLMRKVKKVIKGFDVFGTPMVFNLDGKEKYTSFCGGCSTIIIIVLILLAFQNQIQVFANRELMTSEVGTDYFTNPAPLVLKPKEFIFAVKVEQPDSMPYSKKPFFKIKVTQESSVLENGKRVSSSKRIEMQPCTVEQFRALSADFEFKFTLFKMDEFLCPSDNTELIMQGSQLSNQFHYVRFDVQNCEGRTGQKNWDVACGTQQQIDDYLSKQGQFRFSVFYTNSVINPTSKDEYRVVYLSDDLTFAFQPNIQQQVNVLFKEYVIQTDNSLLPGAEVETVRIVYREEGNHKVDSMFDYSEEHSYVVVNFKSDFIRNVAYRQFQKIDQLFAYFGGMFNLAVLVLGIGVKMYNEIMFKVSMANKLYQFADPTANKNAVANRRNHYLKQIQELQKDDKMCSFKAKLSHLYAYFRDSIHHVKELTPTWRYFLFLLTLQKKFRCQEHLLIEKALKQILADMNVRVLLKRVQEIHKLKHIVFTEAQLQIFNFSQKPSISAHDQLLRQNNIKGEDEHTKGEIEFEKLLSSFKSVVTSQDYKRYKKEQILLRDLSQPPASRYGHDTIFANRLVANLGTNVQKILQSGIKLIDDQSTGLGPSQLAIERNTEGIVVAAEEPLIESEDLG